MKRRKITIILENRDSSDPEEIVLQLEREVKKLTIDLGTSEENHGPEIIEEKKEKKEVVRDEVAEIKAHDTVKEVLNKNEDDNLDQKEEDQPGKKEKALKRLGKFCKEGYEITVRAVTQGVTEGLQG